MTNSPEDFFVFSLKKFCHKNFLHRLPYCALQAVLWTTFPAGLVILGARLGRSLPGNLLILFLAWLTLLLLLTFRHRPRLAAVAHRLDQLSNDDSKVEVALNLCTRRAQGEFARYAIAQGQAVLDQHPATFPLPALALKYWLGGLLFLSIALWCPLPQAAVSAPTSRSNSTTAPSVRTGGSNSATSPQALPPENPLTQPTQPGQRKSFPYISPESGRSLANSARRAQTGESQGSAVQSSGGDGEARRTEAERAKANQAQNAQLTPPPAAQNRSGGGTSGSQEQNGSESSELQSELAASSAGGNRLNSQDKRRPKPVRKKAQKSRGGIQPLLADNAPPAGRDLSEDEGVGDTNDNGRGGETGQKKSRGAASALPVIPLPDTVTGRLGPGEDITAVEHSRPGRGNPGTSSAGQIASQTEPASDAIFTSQQMRKKLRQLIFVKRNSKSGVQNP